MNIDLERSLLADAGKLARPGAVGTAEG